MELKKSNRVSWASAPNLCQVKHFLQEDCPSKVGRGSQPHHQLKQSHLSSIRPSFAGRHCLKQPKGKLPYIPQAKWKCPPKFNLNGNWCVVAGEESKEANAQKHRVKRVLEAVYPSLSAIPPNPSTSLYLDQCYDDNQTPVIPIIPIEESTDFEVSCNLTPLQNTCSELSDLCPPNSSSSSSISIDTSQKLSALGKSFSQSLSTSPFSAEQPANEQSAPPYISSRSELSQVSRKPPVNYNPVPQYPSTCKNITIPPHNPEIYPKLPAKQISANGTGVPRYQSNENLSGLHDKNQVCSDPPANEKSVAEIPNGFEGDLVVATAAAVATFAKRQLGSLIDTDFLIKLLSKPEEIQKLMSEHGMAANSKTGAASDSKSIVPSSTTPSSTADLLDKQIRCGDADSTFFSRSLEVRNTNEQRETAATSRLELTRTKLDKVSNKPINEHQAPHAGSKPIFGPQQMTKSVPFAKSMKSNLVSKHVAPAHVGTADIRGIRQLAYPTPDLNMERNKKLINAYGAPEPLIHSELVPSSFSECDMAVSSRASLSIALQPELQRKSNSLNTSHTSPFSSLTSPAPLHKDVNYYKSLIKQHGQNHESFDQRNTNSMKGPEFLNVKPNQHSMNFQKHCDFFNTSRGCLKGSTCPFLHDVPKQWRSGGMLEAPGSKRMKLGGELTGRT